MLVHSQGSGLTFRPLSEQDLIDGRSTNTEHSVENSKVTIINACDLFKQPCRASRPDHIVIILRGLPGLLIILFIFLIILFYHFFLCCLQYLLVPTDRISLVMVVGACEHLITYLPTAILLGLRNRKTSYWANTYFLYCKLV